MKIKKFTHLIGIDAGGGKRCALAVYSVEAACLLELFCDEFRATYHFLERFLGDEQKKVAVLLEDPRKDKATFGASREIRIAYYSKNYNTLNKLIGKYLARARGVGECIALIRLFERLVREKCADLALIPPSHRNRADTWKLPIHTAKMPTKTNSEQFRKLCGWIKRSNEHSRDAATLCLNNFWKKYLE